MNFWKNFLSNSFLLSTTELLNKGFPFIVIIFIINILGVEINGQFAAAMALGGLFTIFTDIGLSTLLVRDVSRDYQKASFYVSIICSIKIFLSLIVMIIGMIFIFYTKDIKVFGIFALGLFYTLLDNANVNVFQTALRAINKVNKEAVSKLVRGLTLFVGGLLGVLVFKNIYGVLIGYIISTLIQLFVNIYYCRKYHIILKIKIEVKKWREFMIKGRQFFINNLLLIVYYSVGTTALSYLKGDVETGLYNSAYIFYGGFFALGSVLNMAVFPLFSNLYINSRIEWLKLYKKVSIFTLLFSFFGVAVLFFIAPLFLSYIVKDQQVGKAIISLQILSVGLIFCFQNTIFNAFFNSSHNEKKLVIPAIFGTIVNIILNLLLIPHYGLYGASLTTAFTEFIVFVILLILFFRIKTKKNSI